GQLASVSFGQGELLATPIQIAAYFNTFANNGVYVSPSLVEGLLNPRTGKIEKSFYHPVQVKAMSDSSAEMLKEMLTSVVLNGLAKKAKPTFGLAAGKTGTAQTGRYFTEENGNEGELYESWFVGFYPVDKPQYTICILEDETHTIKDGCSEIFAEICNSLYYLDQKRI
ncbi:MAG: penicillin-binding transpeptidase domain-containing protein, partial [Oscillospiraceae bacterium]